MNTRARIALALSSFLMLLVAAAEARLIPAPEGARPYFPLGALALGLFTSLFPGVSREIRYGVMTGVCLLASTLPHPVTLGESRVVWAYLTASLVGIVFLEPAFRKMTTTPTEKE